MNFFLNGVFVMLLVISVLWGVDLHHHNRVNSTVDVKWCLMKDVALKESLEYMKMVEGMACRIGNNTETPTPLQRFHIRWMLN